MCEKAQIHSKVGTRCEETHSYFVFLPTFESCIFAYDINRRMRASHISALKICQN